MIRLSAVWLAVPALGSIGCADKAEPDPTVLLCNGGGDPSLSLGTGSRDGFVPFESGDTVLVEDSGGTLGITLSILTTGLATADPVSTDIQITIDGATGDALAYLSLQCPSEGPAWIAVFAALPANVQGEDPATLSGMDLSLLGVGTDSREITAASTSVDLTVE